MIHFTSPFRLCFVFPSPRCESTSDEVESHFTGSVTFIMQTLDEKCKGLQCGMVESRKIQRILLDGGISPVGPGSDR